MAAAHIYGDQRPLYEWLLFQGQGVSFAGWINLGDAHLNNITTPQQLTPDLGGQRRVNLPYPGMPRRGQHPTRIFDRHERSGVPPYGQYHALEMFPFAQRAVACIWSSH